jgi:hypothetical protein
MIIISNSKDHHLNIQFCCFLSHLVWSLFFVESHSEFSHSGLSTFGVQSITSLRTAGKRGLWWRKWKQTQAYLAPQKIGTNINSKLQNISQLNSNASFAKGVANFRDEAIVMFTQGWPEKFYEGKFFGKFQISYFVKFR